ncbi:MAG TPA: hypothetical protein VFD03_08825 [Clostridia bacterium]|nr:hypothetical protein [Clostridia bacterium]
MIENESVISSNYGMLPIKDSRKISDAFDYLMVSLNFKEGISEKIKGENKSYKFNEERGCFIKDILEDGFIKFLSSLEPGDMKSEYLLPTIIDGLIHSGTAKVKLLETNDMWLGLTYKEDKQIVLDAIKKLVAKGTYKEKLFG